jgi:hypothetical protein
MMQVDLRRERRRLADMCLAVMGGTGALKLFAIILAIAEVRIVWLSWALLNRRNHFSRRHGPSVSSVPGCESGRERERPERIARLHCAIRITPISSSIGI